MNESAPKDVEKLESAPIEGRYDTYNGSPVWVNPSGTLEEYTHQDGSYRNLCASQWCRCQQ